MKGFHIDMNSAQFTEPYLETWLKRLAKLGYDTILWDVENNIRWNTVPECAAPEAFFIDEFRDLLRLAQDLGLQSIPLLQVLAHCEYVLKHPRYRHLSEHPDSIKQYCPRNPQLIPFLNRWIEEYLEIFGPVRYFHIGGDESWWLASCEQCKRYAQQHSIGELYLSHINAIVGSLLDKGIRPILWADMVLSHPQIADHLSRDIVMFDWMYDIFHGSGKVWIWGDLKMCQKHEIPVDKLAHYHRYLFPHGDAPGREPVTFYTADFLREKGFTVVTCPSSSHHGDTSFAGRSYLHLADAYDSWHTGLKAGGSVLTSWTIHLHPWELQLPTIELAAWVSRNPEGSIDDFQRAFVHEHFGVADSRFWKATGLLAKPVLFGHTESVGNDKTCSDIPLTRVRDGVEKLRVDRLLEGELCQARQRLAEYREAQALFSDLVQSVQRGSDLIRQYELAARNLVHRAEAVVYLLTDAGGVPQGDPSELRKRLLELRDETDRMYGSAQKPLRRAQIITWLYTSLEQALDDHFESDITLRAREVSVHETW